MGLFSKKTYTLSEVEFEIDRLQTKVKSTKVNHILHLLLCIPTAGFWIIAWILIVISASMEKSGYEKELKEFYQMRGRLQKKKEDKQKENEIENTPHLDKTEKLIKLSEMLEKGLITEEEFKTQKATIL